MKTPNELDKLIAKFCAPNDESDRPIYCAVVEESPKQQRSKRMIQTVLDAIATAKEKAMASGEPLPSKTQILSECGLSSNVMHRYTQLFAAYEAARGDCVSSMPVVKPEPSTEPSPSLVKTEYRIQVERQILEAIAKAEAEAIANGEPLANKNQIMKTIGKHSHNFYYYPEALKAYSEALERVGGRIGRSSNFADLVKQEIIKARDVALQNGWEMPTRAKIARRAGVSGHSYITQNPSCQALYVEAQKACLEAIKNRHQPQPQPEQVAAPSFAPQNAPTPAPDKSTIALTIEVSEAVYAGLQRYLESHTDWDSDRVAEAALALFLLQNRTEQGENRELSRVYLDSVFRSSAA